MNKWKNVFPLFVMTFITASSVYFIIPIIGPFLLNENGFISQKYRHIYYCMALAFPQVFMVLGPPLWGALSDQFGRKVILICALTLVAMSVLISAIGIKCQWAWCLLLGLAFLGITDASDSLAQASVIDLSDGANKSKNINLVNFCGTLGLVAGPLFGGIFSDQKICSAFHYETPFIIAFFLLILNALGILFLYQEPKKIAECTIQQMRIFDFRFLFSSPGLRFLMIEFFMMEIALGIYYQSVSLFLTERLNYSPLKIGSFYAFFACTICLTYLFLTPILSRRLSQYQLIAASFLSISVGGMLLIFVHSEWFIWSISIPLSIGIALIYSLSIILFSDFTHQKDQGKIMGVTTSIVALSFLLAGFIVYLCDDLNFVF